MSGSKVFMFPETHDGLASILASLLSQRGIDPNLLLTMNRNNGFGGEGSWFIWVIFLFFLMGWGGFGRNQQAPTGDLGNLINNDTGRELLMSAIQGNNAAINQLAQTLNCSVDSIQTAICGLSSQIQSVGNQVGLSGQQVINAIQSGNQAIAAQMAQCCCDNKLLVTNQGYKTRIATLEQTNQLGTKIDVNANQLGSKVDAGTNQITNAISAQTALINDRFCALELRDMQAKINQLQEEKSTLQNHISNSNQTNQIQGYIASVVTPLSQEIAAIKAAQPATVTLPYSGATAIPTAMAYNLGITNTGLWY